MAKKATNPQNLKPFKKGVDERRNLKGAPKKLPSLDTLLPEILGDEADNNSEVKQILKAVIKRAKAKGGDRAAEIILDRAYGKAKQSIDMNHNVAVPVTGMIIEK